MNLNSWKAQHGVTVHQKRGAGHRFSHMAYFSTVTMKDGTVRPFTELMHEFSMEALTARHKVAEGEDSLCACIELARLNGLPLPSEPDARPKKQPKAPKPRMTPEQFAAHIAEKQRNNARNRRKNRKRDRIPI